ncbi:large subunit ribosomal protein L14e [Babesia microti strain RI]|uniref:Large subunit ribosomal protein L14e n=1 Tax=Babesia microti (strain RI) TaxID=1133968 RepID=A0A0K3AS35_BABMR|nr:large subunit ribosomal protein L14e [Babesia microti strain RI]CTQ41290.1 large subunit ribosomal protein L14e [Babesia microti strain RI]|eukprot:XP_012649301.1 large subunit ribosomal protein L14e [Babesia microti strain RI]
MGPLFKKFVEPGRLCLITYGPDAGKLCFIVDIITHTRIMIDGGTVTGVERQPIPLKWLKLTDKKIKLPRGSRTKTLKKALETSDVIDQFKESKMGKKLAFADAKHNLNDFERFQLMVAHKHRKNLMKGGT